MTIFVLLLNRVFVHLFSKASKIATSMECYKKNDLLTPKEQQNMSKHGLNNKLLRFKTAITGY